jgi:hypothetical protein
MARAPAARTAAAAEALLAWLQDPRRPAAAVASPDTGTSAAAPDANAPVPVLAPTDDIRCDDAAAPAAGAAPSRRRHGPGGADGRLAAMCPAHTDWLFHHLDISGPADDVRALQAAARGAGLIPWDLDLERMQEDFFLLLMAPPDPQQRTLSVAGARILADELCTAVARRHALAIARVGASRACPFDLHALLPVPIEILRLGPDHPDALAWLWTHWGTNQALRHVTAQVAVEDGARGGLAAGAARLQLGFWSADWTPWRALAQVAERWPALRFKTRPSYDAA